MLFARRALKRDRARTAYVADQGQDAQQCAETLACQAFRRTNGDIGVDEQLCAGCMVCMQISTAFKARKREE